MSRKINAVLFDLDGTLIDTAADFVRIIACMSAQNGWQVPEEALIREQVSAGASAMVKLMLRHNEQLDVDEKALLGFRQQFLDDYAADICVDSCLFTRLEDVLAHFETNNIPWGIVTNKPRYLAEDLLSALNLDKRCSVLVCPQDVSNPKPDPEPMLLALDKLNLPKSAAQNVIYVGDHVRDIEAGAAAGMKTILAAYGYIPPEDKDRLEEWGADYIIDTPEALYDLLLSDEFAYFAA